MSSKLSFDEIVDREARSTARDLIERELTSKGLPMPKESSVDRHIDQLLSANPQIVEAARTRVLAQKTAVTESISAIGGSAHGSDIHSSAAIDIEL